MKLEDFVGNEAVVNRLRAVGLPPAALFTGPEGVGKRTLALLLAGAAQCDSLPDGRPCRRCGSCLRAAAGTHPDIFLVEPVVGREPAQLPEGIDAPAAIHLDAARKKDRKARIIDVDQIRALNREAQFRPFSGKIRCFIIDPAERMNDEAANSLLKTLEEPPPSTRIVLVTPHPDRLLPTVRSRCQSFRFGLLEREQLRSYLEEATGLEQVDLRAAFAGGSLGRALTLDIDTYLTDRDEMLDLLAAGLSGSFAEIFRQLEAGPIAAIAKERERTAEALRHLELLVFDLFYLHTGTPERMLNQDRQSRLEQLVAGLSLDQLRSLLHHIGEAQRDLEGFVRPLLCLEGLWLDLEAGAHG